MVGPGGTQGFVGGDRGRVLLCPSAPVLADWDDRRDLAVYDGGLATPRAIGTISGHGADLFTFVNLVEQLRQHGAVTIAAGGKFHRADIRLGRILGQMHCVPLASALNATLWGLPRPIPEQLNANAAHQKVQRPICTLEGSLDCQWFLPTAQRCMAGHRPRQHAGHHPGGLPREQLEQDFDRQAEQDRGVEEDQSGA